MQRRLNIRLLCWSVGVVAALVIGVNALHAYQLRRNAHHLFERAEQALAEKDYAQVLANLGKYLALVPGDVDALATFALTLDKTARDLDEKTRVILRLEDVLTRDPTRHDVRERLVHNLVALARYPDALIHLRQLLPHSAKQAELHELLGQCHAAVGDAAAAVTDFSRVVELDPARTSSYLMLADVLQRKLAQDEEAVRVIDRMVDANPKTPGSISPAAAFCGNADNWPKRPRTSSVRWRCRPTMPTSSWPPPPGPNPSRGRKKRGSVCDAG